MYEIAIWFYTKTIGQCVLQRNYNPVYRVQKNRNKYNELKELFRYIFFNIVTKSSLNLPITIIFGTDYHILSKSLHRSCRSNSARNR